MSYRDRNPLIGRVIKGVFLAEDGGAIKFEIDNTDGQNIPDIIARADGDCCSHSWIENVENPEACLGEVLVAHSIEMPDSHPVSEDERGYGEVIQYYGFKIETAKGTCVIDYRNSSNGYYGGSLVWQNDGYFYGGVFGQNVSKEVWKKLA